MEVPECTKILLSRIQKLEPENVNKIIGYLLLKHNQQEIIECAYGTDELLYSLISEAKAFPQFSPTNISAPLHPLGNEQLPYKSFSPAISRRPSSFPSFRVPEPNLDIPHFATEQQLGIRHFDPPDNDLFRDPNYQADVSNLEEHLKSLNPFRSDNSSNYYPNFELGRRPVSGTGIRSPLGVPNFPSRACYGPIPDNFSQMYSPNMYKQVNEQYDHAFSPRPLERLEMEITRLLRIRRGMPVPIAALPMLYYEMYGRRLHAERYLTESQWHSGISLVQLLAGLKGIRLIDRPHGQLSVVLAEETPKHMEYWNEMGYSGVLGRSDQIYLTFPAESSFTDEDVFNYFQQYGPVRDVRIPHQEKRMFGFVSFLYPETVKLILAKNIPHYVCGARVLVKPYKEKLRPNDKKFLEKIELPRHYNFFEMDPDFNSSPRACEDPRLQNQLIRNRELALELERMHFLGLHGAPKPPKPVGYCGNRGTESNIPNDQASVLPNLKNALLTDKETKHTSNTSEQDSKHIELPKSPSASP